MNRLIPWVRRRACGRTLHTLIVTLAVCGGLWWAASASAGEGAPKAARGPARDGIRMTDYMFKGVGGIVEIIILACSVAAVALAADYALTIRFRRALPEAVLNLVRRDIERGDLREVLSVCEENPCFFTRVLEAAIRYRRHGWDTVKTAVEDETEKQAALLHGRLSYLAFIANIAPMLGLQGTVIGMIGAFSKIGGSDASSRFANLAGDIAIALITTATGLFVAIPAMAVFFFFRNRINKIVLDVDTQVMLLVEKLIGGPMHGTER